MIPQLEQVCSINQLTTTVARLSMKHGMETAGSRIKRMRITAAFTQVLVLPIHNALWRRDGSGNWGSETAWPIYLLALP